MTTGLIGYRAAHNPITGGGGGGGGVQFDAVSSVNGDLAGSFSFLHTPVSPTPSGAICMMGWFNGEYNTVLTGAKYGGVNFVQNCTLKGPIGTNIDHGSGPDQGNYWQVVLLGLPNPPGGPRTVQIDFSGLDIYPSVGVLTVTGSDLTNIFRATGVTNSGTSTTPTLVIPSAAGDMAIDVIAGGSSWSGSGMNGLFVTNFAASPNARRFQQAMVEFSVNSFTTAGSTLTASGASATMGWTKAGDAAAYWLMAGASIKAAIPPVATLNLSSNTALDSAAINSVIGTLSVTSGTGTYNYSFVSNPGTLFNISGSSLRVNAPLTAGTDLITIQADNGAGGIVTQAFSIVVSASGTEVTGWNRLKIGGGGFVYSGSFSDDGVTQTVSTDSGGALVSVSGGVWQQVQRGGRVIPTSFTPNGNTRRFGGSYSHIVAPSDHNRVYLLTAGTPQTGYMAQQLYISNDGGTTYNQTAFPGVLFANENDGQYRVNAPKMAVDPHNKDVLIFTLGGRTNNFNGYTWNATGAHTTITIEQSVPFTVPTGQPVSFDSVPTGLVANTQYKLGAMTAGVAEVLTLAGAAIPSSGATPGGGNISFQSTWYSTDGGTTCTLVNGVPAASPTGPDCGICFDPSSWTSGNTPGVYLFHQGSGLYHSSTGVTGTFTLQGTCPTTQAINGKCSFDGTYYLANETNTSAAGTTGAFRWKSGAWTTLSNVTAQLPFPTAVCPSRTIAGKVVYMESVASGGGRIVVSTDYGATCSTFKSVAVAATDCPWLALTTDVGTIAVGDLIEDPLIVNKFWLMAGTGVYYSTDQSGSTVNWTSTVPGTVVAVNNGDQGGEQSGISTDGGANWTLFPTPLPAPWLGASVGSIAASSPSTMLWIHAYAGGVHYTRNGGTSWTPITNAQWGNGMAGGDFATAGGWNDLPGYTYRQNVCADRVLTDTFYLQNAQTAAAGGGIYKVSFPGGTLTIARQSTAYANPAPSAYMLNMLAVPGQASTFFISSGEGQSTSSGLQWSFDGGVSLSQITGIGEVYAFGIGVAKPGNDFPSLFVTGFKGGVWGVWRGDGNLADWKAGSNTGSTVTWTNIGIPFNCVAQIKSITGDGLVWGRCYLGTNTDGCFYYKP